MTRIAAAVAVALLALSGTACQEAHAVTPTPVVSEPAPTTGTVSLHLVDAQSGAPVRLAEISADGTFLGKSDETSGVFAWHVTYGHGYALTIYHGEYNTVRRTVTPTTDTPTITIQMERLK